MKQFISLAYSPFPRYAVPPFPSYSPYFNSNAKHSIPVRSTQYRSEGTILYRSAGTNLRSELVEEPISVPKQLIPSEGTILYSSERTILYRSEGTILSVSNLNYGYSPTSI